MDGSAPAFYFRQGKNNDINKTLIYLGGGGWIVKYLLNNIYNNNNYIKGKL